MVDQIPVPGPSLTSALTRPKGVSGKISVPVRPLTAVYARFRHIVGVPTRNSATQVPIMKLRILDNLIHSYVSANGARLRLPAPSDIQVNVDARTVDTYIAALGEQLRTQAIAPPAGADFLVAGAALSLRA